MNTILKMKKFHPGDQKGIEIPRRGKTVRNVRNKGVLENGKCFRMTNVSMEAGARRRD